jgi:uncharacterized lipoprotein YmbA
LTSASPARTLDPSGAPAAALDRQSDVVLGLGRIEMPDYLLQPGLVLETAEYQIRPATYHRWGEPLPRGVRRALVENLTAALPGVRVDGTSGRDRREYQLDVEIERFHGTEQGTVALGGRWSLHHVDGHRLLASEPFIYEGTLTHPGYRASVEVQAELLARLSAAIASRFQAVLQ